MSSYPSSSTSHKVVGGAICDLINSSTKNMIVCLLPLIEWSIRTWRAPHIIYIRILPVSFKMIIINLKCTELVSQNFGEL